MTLLTALPPKVLFKIFEEVHHQTSTRPLAGYSVLCRAFRSACQPFLFRRIEVSGPQPWRTNKIRRLASILAQNAQLSQSIHAFTLNIMDFTFLPRDAEPIVVDDLVTLGTILSEFTRTLPRPSALSSVTLNVEIAPDRLSEDIPSTLYLALIDLISSSNRLGELRLFGVQYPMRILPFIRTEFLRHLFVFPLDTDASRWQPIHAETTNLNAFPQWPKPRDIPLVVEQLQTTTSLAFALLKPRSVNESEPTDPIVAGASLTQLCLRPTCAEDDRVHLSKVLNLTHSLTELALESAGPGLRMGTMAIPPSQAQKLTRLIVSTDGMDGLEKIGRILSTFPPDNVLSHLSIEIVVDSAQGEVRWPTPRSNWAQPLFVLGHDNFPSLDQFSLHIYLIHEFKGHSTFDAEYSAVSKLYHHLKELSLDPLKERLHGIRFGYRLWFN